jgi:flavin reductase (DIM6/NTAB) family NADH-FMN oxidoreductase RutF
MIELNLETDFADRAYQLLVSLVVPRPIALVTTLSSDEKINAAPFSFFNVMGANPPICAFAPADRANGVPKDTALNVRATHEFVVNLVDESIAGAMNQCAASLPYGENELAHAGLTAAPSSCVKPPADRRSAGEFGVHRVGHAAGRRQPRGHRHHQAHSPPRRALRCGDPADSL